MYLAGHVNVRDAMRELTEAGYVVETDNHHVYARANANGYPHRLMIRGGTVSRLSMQKLINKKGK